MKIKKTAWILVISILFNLSTVFGAGMDLETTEAFNYEETRDGTIRIIEYVDSSDDIVVPGEIEGKPVTELGKDLFEGRTINSIELPSSLKKINGGVFYNTTINCDVVIPEGVSELGNFPAGVFAKSTVNGDIIFPSTMTSYMGQVFKGATVNGRVTVDGYSGLEDGYRSKKIDLTTFKDADYIKTIDFTGAAQLLKGNPWDWTINVDELIIGEGVEEIGIFPFFKHFNMKGPIELPSTLKIIHANAYQDTKLEYPLLIDKNVERIVGGAFEGAIVPLVEIDEGVSDMADGGGWLGNDIFASSHIDDIELPSTVVKLGDSMFEEANFKNIVIYNDKVEFGKDMFSLSEDTGKEINIIGFENLTTKDFVKELNKTLPNIKFKNFVDINQTVNGNDKEVKIGAGDILEQKAKILVNESRGYNNLDRTFGRHINIDINEEMENFLDIESIKVYMDSENEIPVKREDNSIGFEIPKNKFLGERPIYMDLKLKVREGVSLPETSNLVIGADIENKSGVKESLYSNTIELKNDSVNVSLDANGGQYKDSSLVRILSLDKGGRLSEDNLEVPVREGYKFEGWYSDREGKLKFDFTKDIESDLALYANWTKENTSPSPSYPIVNLAKMTLDANGGNFGNETYQLELKKGDRLVEPKRPGYKFLGWSTKENGEVEKTTGDLQELLNKLNANKKYYAQWEKEKLNKQDHFAYIKGYEDRTVRGGDYISREEVATVFYRLLEEDYRESIDSVENDFKDVKADRWSNEAISTLVKGGILDGYLDSSFRPANRITRGEVAKIASKFDDLSGGTSKFSDIDGHWAEEYIVSATEKGWIKGYADGSFKPDNNITRGEFVTLVNNVLERKVKKENILNNTIKFKDLKEDRWYYEAIVEAANGHIYEKDRLEDGSEIWIKLKDF